MGFVVRMRKPVLLAEQMEHDEIGTLAPSVVELLEDFQTSFWAWKAGVMPAADFLESQHSFVVNLALQMAPGADTSDHYPVLVKKLMTEESILRQELLDLGINRNKVKHRGQKSRASAFAHQGLNAVWRLASTRTGFLPGPCIAFHSTACRRARRGVQDSADVLPRRDSKGRASLVESRSACTLPLVQIPGNLSQFGARLIGDACATQTDPGSRVRGRPCGVCRHDPGC